MTRENVGEEEEEEKEEERDEAGRRVPLLLLLNIHSRRILSRTSRLL